MKKVTSVAAICDAMNSNNVFKELLPAVHMLIRLYITIPITSSTSERSFSALKRLYTYLRSSMKENRLNNCLMLHIHKDYTDQLDLTAVAKEFVDRCDRSKYFGYY